MLLQRDANLSLLRSAWAPGHGCTVCCAKCHPTGQGGNPIVVVWVFIQWGPLGQCLDVWRKSYRIILICKPAPCFSTYLRSQTVPEPSQVLLHLHLVSSSAAPMFGGNNVVTLLLLSLCFSSTLFFSAFGRLVILPRGALKRRHPVVPHRDSRQWVVRIWSLTGNKVCFGFYLQSRSICISIAGAGFRHLWKHPWAACSMPAQHSPASDIQLWQLELPVCWDLSLPATGWTWLRLPLTRARQTLLELSSHCSSGLIATQPI